MKRSVPNSGGYRNPINVIADILRVAMDEPNKTRIMFKAKLSHRDLTVYLNNLMRR